MMVKGKSPKLPKDKKKPKKPLKEHLRDQTRKAMADTLKRNLGFVGSAIAKRYIAPPKSSKKRPTDTKKPTVKDIHDKKISDNALSVDAIQQSANNVAAAVDTVAGNATRAFAATEQQVEILGETITGSFRDFNSLLDRLLFQHKAGSSASEGTGASPVTPVEKGGSTGGGGFNLLGLIPWKALGALSISPIRKGAGLFSGSTGITHTDKDWEHGGRDDVLKDMEKRGYYVPSLHQHDKQDSENITGKTKIGDDQHVLHKIKYSAQKITFKVKDKLEFNTKISRGTSTSPQVGGTLNRFFDKLRGGPGGAGFFNNLADKLFGTGGGDHKGGNSKTPDVSKREPSKTTSDSTPISTNGKEVPPEVLSKAEGLLKDGGNSQDLQQFMSKEGYPMRGNWCGEFAAAVVKSVGGTPPRDPAIASNWLKYGQHVDPKYIKPGDVAVRKTSRYGGEVIPGQTGGHVGFVKSIDKNGRFTIEGGNQGSPTHGDAMKNYEFRRAVEKQQEKADATKQAPAEQAQANNATSIAKFANISKMDNFAASGLNPYEFPKGDRWSWLKPRFYDPHTGEKIFEDRRNEPNLYDDDPYSIATKEKEAYQNQLNGNLYEQLDSRNFKPSPLGYALGGRDLLNYEHPRDEIGQIILDQEKHDWDALKPVDKSQPQPSVASVPSPNDPVNRQNTQSYQGTNDTDLDHRPRMVAAPQQDFSDYMGTSNGLEDSE